MVSAERIMEYTKLETEASLETQPPKKKPPPNWPDQGRLEMHGVSFRYASDLPLTLNTLTLTVEPREKVELATNTTVLFEVRTLAQVLYMHVNGSNEVISRA